MSAYTAYDVKEIVFTRAVDGQDLIDVVKENEVHGYEFVSMSKHAHLNDGYAISTSRFNYTLTFRRRKA